MISRYFRLVYQLIPCTGYLCSLMEIRIATEGSKRLGDEFHSEATTQEGLAVHAALEWPS